jgi:hypothetical protein
MWAIPVCMSYSELSVHLVSVSVIDSTGRLLPIIVDEQIVSIPAGPIIILRLVYPCNGKRSGGPTTWSKMLNDITYNKFATTSHSDAQHDAQGDSRLISNQKDEQIHAISLRVCERLDAAVVLQNEQDNKVSRSMRGS